MEIPWPLNTTFRIYSGEDGEENWIVSNKSDPGNRTISNLTALGKALILSGENRKGSYITPDERPVGFVILGIKPPYADWDIYKSPFDYYIDMFYTDPSEIRYNHLCQMYVLPAATRIRRPYQE
jgi:hypothetical protein